jgi:hypothetical protein
VWLLRVAYSCAQAPQGEPAAGTLALAAGAWLAAGFWAEPGAAARTAAALLFAFRSGIAS